MINQLRDQIGVSFKQLEQELWMAMLREFGEALARLLGMIDEQLMNARDKRRYKCKGRERRGLDTLFGMDVSFRRRRYLDVETGDYVYLLDEVLGLSKGERISPGLKAAMLTQAMTTSSYRKAAESLTQLLGFPAVSHESIRQAVIEAGSGIEEQCAEELEEPQGQRKIDVLFIEADGVHIHLQQDRRKQIEEKVLTTHEGWAPRYTGSNEYRLLRVEQFRTNETDFWDSASRFVYSHYDVDENTLVVINGDRASWIRSGVEYFPNAMYQIDRFHLKRDLRRLFRTMPQELEGLFEAVDGTDATGATFLAKLAQATAKLTDPKKHDEATKLLNDLVTIPEATVDYRVRMRARGLSTDGLRGMGAAESQIDRLSDRMKSQGRSWGREGEAAMMELLCARNTGRFDAIVERVQEWYQDGTESIVSLKEAAKRAVRKVLKTKLGVQPGSTPIDSSGTTASGGLSNLMHRINESGMPVGV